MDGIISDWAHKRTNALRSCAEQIEAIASVFGVREHAPVNLCSYKPKGGPAVEPALGDWCVVALGD
jgi:hypothetical protein